MNMASMLVGVAFCWTIPKCQVDATDAVDAKIHRCWSLGNIGIKGALFSNQLFCAPRYLEIFGDSSQ